MADYSYLINGVDTGQWRELRTTTRQLGVDMRRQAMQLPGRAGEVDLGSAPAAPLLTLALSPDGATLDAKVDDIATVLAAPSILLTRVTPSSTRQAVASLVSAVWPPEQAWRDVAAVVIATFSLPGVWWRDTTDTTTAALAAGAAALSSAQVGSAPVTDAVVRFAAAATQPSIVDVPSGTGVELAYTAAAGRYTYVDAGAMRAWWSTSSTQWTRPAASTQWIDSVLGYPGPGPLQITPLLSSGNRAGSVQLSHQTALRYRRSWW